MVLKHFFDQVLDFFNSISKVLYSFFAIIIVRARFISKWKSLNRVVLDVTPQIDCSNPFSSTWIKNFCGVWVDVADVIVIPIIENAGINEENIRLIMINEMCVLAPFLF